MKLLDPAVFLLVFLGYKNLLDLLNKHVGFVRPHTPIQPGAFTRSQALSGRFRSANEREANVLGNVACIDAPFTWRRRCVGFEGRCSAAERGITLRRPRRLAS